MEVPEILRRVVSGACIRRLDRESVWALDVLVVVVGELFLYHVHDDLVQLADIDAFFALYAALPVQTNHEWFAISDRYKDQRSAQFDKK